MVKLCKKEGCNNSSIYKGQYCDLHRTNKKKQKECLPLRQTQMQNYDNELEEVIKLSEQMYMDEQDKCNQVNKKKLDEDRLIREEQEQEYLDAMKADIERQKFLNQQEQYFHTLKQKVASAEEIQDDNFYNIKIKIPNHIDIKKKFKGKCTVESIRNFLNLFFIENNIVITNFNLVLYPNRKITIEDNNILIMDLNLEKNCTLLISNLDS